jgi:secretion/DNA translocation related TadE-like protein
MTAVGASDPGGAETDGGAWARVTDRGWRIGAALSRAGRADQGSASIWLLGIGLMVVTLALMLTTVGTALIARQRAQAAADLGALAGAALIVAGERSACDRAQELVTANGGRMLTCQPDGLELIVTVEVPVAGLGAAKASARAGPIGSADAIGAVDAVRTGPSSSAVSAGRRAVRRSVGG